MRALLTSLGAMLLAGCNGSYTAMAPLNPGPASRCLGSVPFPDLICPNRALWAVHGDLTLSGANATIDSYDRSIGLYGGANILANGHLQAAGKIFLNPSGLSLGGVVHPNMAASVPGGTPGHSTTGSFKLSNTPNFTWGQGDYYYNTMEFDGIGGVAQPQSGQVRIWFNKLIISGDNATIGSSQPNNLWLLGTCGSTVTISANNAVIRAVIYAPDSPVSISGSNLYYEGSIVGDSITISGSSPSFHRDQSICGP